MTPREKALGAFQAWYDALRRPRPSGSAAYKGPICIGLVLLDRLKTNFNLAIDAHLTHGGARIQGLSGRRVQNILATFGETRPFAGEVGGRTTPNSRAYAESLLEAVRTARVESLSEEERRGILSELQEFLVEKVREFHKRQRLKPVYDPTQSTRQFIAELLALAEETGKRGAAAQYLVGAKLQLRFPQVDVRNQSYSAADDPSGEPGDFVVVDTTFHVTVSPTLGHFEKCKRNLQEGRRVFLLVPDSMLVGARQNAELAAPGQIAVESIESFIAQNIEELSTFAHDKLRDGLRCLLETYNARVDEVEIDKSMMVELPRNLAQQGGEA